MSKIEFLNRKRVIVVGGKNHRAPKLVYDIAEFLYRNPGEVYTRDEIIERLWSNSIVEPRTVDVHVNAARKIVGKDRIETFRGVGYSWKED